MKTKELVILTAIIIVALISTFVITNYVQANPTTSHYRQTINADTLGPYPTPDPCFSGSYPGPYPGPSSGLCSLLPMIFKDFDLSDLRNILPGER